MSVSNERRAGPLAMTIDVEDWFHSENVKAAVPRGTWDSCELRVERNTMRILEILAKHGTQGTFFVLGWVADRCPGLVRSIADAGHEIASHGYGHELVYALEPDQFRQDILRSKSMLEDMAGVEVCGYRAPCFSITEWAIGLLQEAGFTYDSSVVPTLVHDRYGRVGGVEAGKPIVIMGEGFHEVCVSCLPFGERGIPWGGGGYFRLLPYACWRRGVHSILDGGLPYVFYIHPWEMDPGQPRMHGLRMSNRLRQSINVERCESRFATLVQEFDWMPIARLLKTWHGDVAADPPNRSRGVDVSAPTLAPRVERMAGTATAAEAGGQQGG